MNKLTFLNGLSMSGSHLSLQTMNILWVKLSPKNIFKGDYHLKMIMSFLK